MTRNSLSAKTLYSKVLSLGATLALVALGTWDLPAFARKTNLETQSNANPQILVARQQRRGRWIEVDLSAQRVTAWNGRKKVRSFMVSTGKRRTPDSSWHFFRSIQAPLNSNAWSKLQRT
jgi:hypothetical protein